MPALNFKKQFVEKILSGEKKQTIRAMRKRPFKVGDRLYLYTGMRTKQCKKIGEAVCTDIDKIGVYTDGVSFAIYKNDCYLYLSEDSRKIAIADGFEGITEFYNFFKARIPFEGHIIYWEKIE